MEVAKQGEKKAATIKILSEVRNAQLTHGLRHNDYQLYRQYCTRRLKRLRKGLDLVQGDKKNFHKKVVSAQSIKDEKALYIPLMSIERCWAFAMQLKEESLQDPRKRFAMRNKLRKAAKYAESFEKLVEESQICDARTSLEVQAYCAWLQGTVLFEMAEISLNWEEPVQYFTKAITIYSKLSKAVADDEETIYKSKLQELEVKMRYCRHELGDKTATSTLLAMRGNEDLGEKLDRLVASAKEDQAKTLSEVKWKDRTLSVKHEKVRLFLLNEGLIHEELGKTSDPEEKADMVDKLLMECKDAIQIIREELSNDSSFKPRQQASEGPTTPLHFLHTYLSYLRLRLTNLRNWSLHHLYRKILNGEKTIELNRKSPKLQDVVRLCEIILQNLIEMTHLAGLETDLELKNEVDKFSLFYKAHRDFYAAEIYSKDEKWPEALAVYCRCSEYINQSLKYDHEQSFREELQNLSNSTKSRKFGVQAKVITNVKSTKVTDKKIAAINKLLVERLDEYIEDISITPPMVAAIPPQMVAVPCKPLFFDLALNHVDFPDLEEEDKPSSPAKQAGGIRGLVRGLWGWGS